MMNNKLWIIGFFVIVLSLSSAIAYQTAVIDPFFHYHKPDTDTYSYRLNNERYQNDGIVKHFDYTGLITGSSMAENFRTSDAEFLWGGNFVKVPFSGGSYKEINDNLRTAALWNENLKIVIRGLDMNNLGSNKDAMNYRIKDYPFYLYDKNPLNDVKYLLNRVNFARVYSMTAEKENADFEGGITSFDKYANWMSGKTFGKRAVLPQGIRMITPKETVKLSGNEIDQIKANITQNVTSLADEFPDITFYYFFTPYSGAYWFELFKDGLIQRNVQGERIVIEEILEHENIKLFSFNCCFDLINDLNNYKDLNHYGEWINSLMLRWMHADKYLLTKDNYEQYLSSEYDFYSSYDYSQLQDSEDFENDYYAAALLNREITGAVPYHVDLSDINSYQISHGEVKENQYNGQPGVVCSGEFPPVSENHTEDHLENIEYSGIKIDFDDVTLYRYLVFYAQKQDGRSRPVIKFFNKEGTEIASYNRSPQYSDDSWHQYVIDIDNAKGPLTLILSSDCYSEECNEAPQFVFSDITLY